MIAITTSNSINVKPGRLRVERYIGKLSHLPGPRNGFSEEGHAFTIQIALCVISLAVGAMVQAAVDLGWMVSVRNRTDPSPKAKLAPPGS